MNLATKHQLNDGHSIPWVGIGTWAMKGNECINALIYALKLGYRHIDTAAYYKNEKEVGIAVRQSEIPREEIFVTSKIWPNDFGYKNTEKAFTKTIQSLDISYLDLYLIHWPSDTKRTEETWKKMLELKDGERLKSIGVSNFSIAQIESLKSLGDEIPAVNQVRFNPQAYNSELLSYCKSEGIAVVAYSPLGEGRLVGHPKIEAIALKYSKTSAQVLLRWGLQMGTIQIPKSSNPTKIKENSEIFDFELTKEDMEILGNL